MTFYTFTQVSSLEKRDLPPSECSHHNVLLLQLRQHKVTLATTPNPVVSAQSAVAPLQRFNASTIYAAKPFSA
ncbi:MAG: hypothetical protein DMF09_00280 [Verrucomicrobia bacterium]|nr:MAG: hypothetical protein DMF09_00280 [Verrucomicrobiota bacterium]